MNSFENDNIGNTSQPTQPQSRADTVLIELKSTLKEVNIHFVVVFFMDCFYLLSWRCVLVILICVDELFKLNVLLISVYHFQPS